MNTFSVKECLKFGWNTFKKRPGLFLLVPLVTIAAAFGIGIVIGFAKGILSIALGKSVSAFLGSIATNVVQLFITIGVITLYLKAHDNVSAAALKDLWNPKPFWRLLGMSILTFICVAVGMVLLIVPGIILAVMFSLAGYLVVERGLNPIASLKESARLTKGNRWKIFQLSLATVVLNLVGLIALVVGLLVTVPVSFLAFIHAYRALSSSPKPVESAAVAPAPAPAPVRAVG